MKQAIVFVGLLLVTTLVFAALPAPSEIPKEGDCPSDYSAKGSQCFPGANAKFAFVKFQHCPAGYIDQGNYCIATAEAKLAIRRAAMSCPSGFESVGNYCISEK
jgi:hypothetical protein